MGWLWIKYILNCLRRVMRVMRWFEKPKSSESQEDLKEWQPQQSAHDEDSIERQTQQSAHNEDNPVEKSSESMDFLFPVEETHSLLEDRSPAYSQDTIRRAFIVWLRCGQRNDFAEVCKFYHYLEASEDQLPAEERAASRDLDFSLYVNPPPTSPFQQQYFPHLYPPAHMVHYACLHAQAQIRTFQIAAQPVRAEDIKEEVYSKYNGFRVTPQEIFDASQVFKTPAETVNDKKTKLEVSEFLKLSSEALKKEEMRKKTDVINVAEDKFDLDDKLKGTSKQDILETSQMIKNYCKERQVPLRNFLENFKEYATRCKLTNTVNNVGFYIKRKLIHAELTLAVIVHRTKYENALKADTKPLPLLIENEADENHDSIEQNPMKLFAPFSPLTVQDNNNIINGKIDKLEDSKHIIAYNEDLITFEEEVPFVNTDKSIKLLKREDGIMTCAGFSSPHNIGMLETLRCRKI